MKRVELAHPPSTAVPWHFMHTSRSQSCSVEARTWFAAREKAMKLLACGPDELRLISEEAP